MLILIYISLYCVNSQHFDLDDYQKRIQKGKQNFDKLNQDRKYHSPCWEKALSKLKNGCRKMHDTEQSYLALQFANCHLERSGLETYDCDVRNFKSCTKQMASNIIAFQSYTEFFTHVTDICFYLQSEIWRENTELTIEKLSKTSVESLETISKSMQQQKEVLSAQEESLKNQRDILHNEKMLSEALVNSAESARDVFLEVRDHAKEQKAVFSETFKHIFDSVEKLSNLQKMLLGEFIGIQSFAFYFIASIVCYLFTSTPRASGARLPLFILLSVLIVTERISVSWKIGVIEDEELTSEMIHERIWWIRKCFLLVATIVIGYYIMNFKDFNRINFTMLQQIQDQICEIKKLQETQNNPTCLDDDKTLVSNADKLEEATKQLEMSLLAYSTSTPEKEPKSFGGCIIPTSIPRLNVDSYDESWDQQNEKKTKEPGAKEIKAKVLKKKLQDLSVVGYSSDGSLSESRYNLRSRTSFNNSSLNITAVNNSKTSRRKSINKKPKGGSRRKPEYSSDDE